MVDTRTKVAKVSDGLRSLAFGNPLYSLSLGHGGPTFLEVVPPDPWPGDAERGSALASGEYSFAGRTLVSDVPLWLPLGVGDAYLEALHGFDWLRDLRALGGDTARRHARALVASWIDRHNSWHAVVWRPDVLGRRVANWLGMHDFFCASADDHFRARTFASLARQTRHLARALPGGLKGAPLLAALKGLFYGILCLPDGRPRLEPALKLLLQELQAQVLPDGGHVQRNPQIHLEALRHLIDIRGAMRAARTEVPEALQHAIDKMAPALRFFRHGDGGLALFNGAREGEPVLIDTVLAQADAHGRPLKSGRHSGFERVQAGRLLLLMDVGPPPAPGLDSGAHAGALSFELSVGRERLIVNCGAWGGFDPDPQGEAAGWETALRGTAAHSTLTAADTNSSELIDGGGLGRRPRQVTAERLEEDRSVLLEAEHDGYRAPYGARHNRRLFIGAGGDDLRGEDTLTGAADLPFAVRFHLHPAVHVSPLQGGDAALLKLASGAGWRLRVSGAALTVEESIYCGEDVAVRRSSQIVLSARTGADKKAPTSVKWALKRERRDRDG
ncbi:MAG: hypothetical protein HKM95_13750 [Inquilinus sp.]|nr:hypothetical protein [Inquilinus sp.]